MEPKTQPSAALSLAKKYQIPTATVEHLLELESETLAAQASVTAYIPLIVARRVEDYLRANADTRVTDLPQAA